jgi:hypothetical protein
LTTAALVVLAGFAVRNWSGPQADNTGPPEADKRLSDLRLRIEREVAAADAAVQAYRLKVDIYLWYDEG